MLVTFYYYLDFWRPCIYDFFYNFLTRCCGIKHFESSCEYTHAGDEPFKCQTNDKPFECQTFHSKQHFKRHSKFQPFKCQTCQVSFKTSWKYLQTIRSLENQALWNCKDSLTKVISNLSVKHHSLQVCTIMTRCCEIKHFASSCECTNKGDEPFKCQKYDKPFECQSFHWKQHVKHHSKFLASFYNSDKMLGNLASPCEFSQW